MNRMKVRFWLSHRPLILFLVFAIILSGVLGWLGWRMLEQDRALENQRRQEKLESAADLVATALLGQFSAIETRLTKLLDLREAQFDETLEWLPQKPSADFLFVVLAPDRILTYPPQRLLYYPAQEEAVDPAEEVFGVGEDLEIRQKSYENAVAVYRELARSEDPAVRSGALLRLGRVLRKSRRAEEALRVYDQLAKSDSAVMGGLPAELISRYARCTILKELERTSDLQGEARTLYSGLQKGRWRIPRATYYFYTQEVSVWLNSDAGLIPKAGDRDLEPARTFAAAVEFLWDEWRHRNRNSNRSAARRVLRFNEGAALAAWKTSPVRAVAFIATPRFVERHWLGSIKRLEEIRLALRDSSGKLFLTQFEAEPPRQIIRATTESGLPWTLHIASADPRAESAQWKARRRLLFAGFVGFAAALLISSYFVARAVGRELELAQLKSDFVAAVSHDFRTPLTSLRQLTELLKTGRVSGKEREQKYYQVLSRESQRLSRLVEGLLDFGRMEAGASQYRLAPLDVSALVRETVQEFQEQVEDRGYRVELAEKGPGAAIQGDPEALSRALYNLLDNAVKYSPECHTIWVEAELRNQHLAIRVRDRGVGIRPEEQEDIFKKFVRGSAAQVASARGSGIGLAMVRHIVESHGGIIDLESQPGVGSTFTILLPVRGE